MRFDLDDQQRLLGQTAREFFASVLPTTVMRRLHDEGRFDRSVWRAVADQGWAGALVDEAYGGLGLELADVFPVLEAAGGALAPLPLIEGAVIAPLLIRGLADAETAARWLTGIADGSLLATVALYEDADILTPPRLGVSAHLENDTWVLDGIKDVVPFGADADVVLVLASTPGGPAIFGVPTNGLHVESLDHTDAAYRFARLEFDAVRVPTGHTSSDPALLERAVRAGRVAMCADALGGAERCLAMSVDYAGQRVQFDRPIGAFQAIKHKLADMFASVERMRSLAYAATGAFDAQAIDDPIVEAAKALCDEAYRFVTHEAIQVHGGIGFTWEHDIHFYYKRALRYSVTLGTARQLLFELGARLANGDGWQEFVPAAHAHADALA